MATPNMTSDVHLQFARDARTHAKELVPAQAGLLDTVLSDADASLEAPGEVVGWLARLRVLHGVPFNHLAVHDEMLPTESIRFFYLDRNWTDAAVDGALSVAAITARDRELLTDSGTAVRASVDRAERRIRAVEDAATTAAEPLVIDEVMEGGRLRAAPRKRLADGPADRLSGFVLRSQAVSGWPGMEVSATEDGRRLRFMRLERLAPGVLLALVDGIPDRVELTEPRSGLQFGVDWDAAETGVLLPLRNPATGAQLPLRDAQGRVIEPRRDATFTSNVPAAQREGGDLRVPVRKGGHGTVHVAELVRRLRNTSFEGRPLVAASGTAAGVASDDLAVQLLQFPYRQPFEGDGERGGGGGRFGGFVREDLLVHAERVFLRD